jgi:hypothetical protein
VASEIYPSPGHIGEILVQLLSKTATARSEFDHVCPTKPHERLRSVVVCDKVRWSTWPRRSGPILVISREEVALVTGFSSHANGRNGRS